MSRQQWLSILGVWVMVFWDLGFPVAWKPIIAVITGLLIIYISFKMSPRNISKDKGGRTYVEHDGKSSW